MQETGGCSSTCERVGKRALGWSPFSLVPYLMAGLNSIQAGTWFGAQAWRDHKSDELRDFPWVVGGRGSTCYCSS